MNPVNHRAESGWADNGFERENPTGATVPLFEHVGENMNRTAWNEECERRAYYSSSTRELLHARKDAARSVFPIRYQNIAEKCRNWYRQKNKEEKLSRDTQRDGTFFPDVVAQRIFHALSRSNGPRPCEIDRSRRHLVDRIADIVRTRDEKPKRKRKVKIRVAWKRCRHAATLRSRGRSEGNVEECKPLLRVHARTSQRMIEVFGKIPPRRISRGQETGFRIRYWSKE